MYEHAVMMGSVQLLGSSVSIDWKALILLYLLIAVITNGWVVITGVGLVSATSDNATGRRVLLRKYAPW